MQKVLKLDEIYTKYKNKIPNWGYNGLGYIVYKRTYSRLMSDGKQEEWIDTIKRVINGAQEIGADYTQEEAERLFDYIFNLKCSFAGRMLWMLGTEHIKRWGGNALLNCWFSTITKYEDFCFIFENLMLGGGVGFSVRREDIHELSKIKENVKITHQLTKDADFIVPDSREGWVYLLRKVLKCYFETGKSFSYSTILIRKYGEEIKGLGGTASGSEILVSGIENICKILDSRVGKKLRSIEVLDICNIIGSIVVSGNIRRSAQVALGDPDDYLFIRAKRWDLGTIPNWRALSNNSIYADDFTHISNDIWEGYQGNGECYGFFNIKLSQKYGRLGEIRKDNCEGGNPCFSGETIIATAEGRNGVSIKQLAEESQGIYKIPIYSAFISNKVKNQFGVFNKTKNTIKTQIKNAVVFKTGTKEIIEIILSDNSSFKCTPEHKLCLKDGNYKEAKDCLGLELNKFFSFSNKNSFKSYRTINSISSGYNRQYRMIWENSNGIYDTKKYNIDHIDSISTNDNLLNLRLIKTKEHRKISARKMLGKNNAFYRIKNKDIYLHNQSVSTTIKNYKRSGKSDKEIQNLLDNKKLKFIKSPDNNIYLNKAIFVKDIKYTKEIVDVYDLKVEDNFNFYIITKTDDKQYLNSSGILVHNCLEITLANKECCDLSELYLNNIESKKELIDCAKLLYKTQKAICNLNFLHEDTNKIVRKNMRIGIGITGICQSMNKIEWLDDCYNAIRKFDKQWSKKKKYNESIKISTIKPSGTLSLLSGATPGIHPAYSKYYIRRIRMSKDDKLVNICQNLGYKIVQVENYDGSKDERTIIVEFPCFSGDNTIVAKDMTAIKQLELVKLLQTKWSDNSISVTVYYKKEELMEIKKWLKENYKDGIKSVSFLLHKEHGFKQSPYEEITEEKYKELMNIVKPIQNIMIGYEHIEFEECSKGGCPIK